MSTSVFGIWIPSDDDDEQNGSGGRGNNAAMEAQNQIKADAAVAELRELAGPHYEKSLLLEHLVKARFRCSWAFNSLARETLGLWENAVHPRASQSAMSSARNPVTSSSGFGITTESTSPSSSSTTAAAVASSSVARLKSTQDNNNNNNNNNRLPTDLLSSCFTFLDFWTIISVTPLVCRTWLGASYEDDSLWEAFSVRQWADGAVIRQLSVAAAVGGKDVQPTHHQSIGTSAPAARTPMRTNVAMNSAMSSSRRHQASSSASSSLKRSQSDNFLQLMMPPVPPPPPPPASTTIAAAAPAAASGSAGSAGGQSESVSRGMAHGLTRSQSAGLIATGSVTIHCTGGPPSASARERSAAGRRNRNGGGSSSSIRISSPEEPPGPTAASGRTPLPPAERKSMTHSHAMAIAGAGKAQSEMWRTRSSRQTQRCHVPRKAPPLMTSASPRHMPLRVVFLEQYIREALRCCPFAQLSAMSVPMAAMQQHLLRPDSAGDSESDEQQLMEVCQDGHRTGSVVPVVYGFPSTQLLEAARAGHVVMGMDHIPVGDWGMPVWCCRACRRTWRKYPWSRMQWHVNASDAAARGKLTHRNMLVERLPRAYEAGP